MDAKDLAEVIQAAIDARMSRLHTAAPARVVSYNKARNTVDVEPQFHNTYEVLETGELVHEKASTIQDVPIAWPRAGGHSVTFPLAKGDPVLLVYCERDLGQWRAVGEAGPTGDLRPHRLSGAVAYPGGAFAEGEALPAGSVADDAITLVSKVLLGSATAAQKMVLGDIFKTAYDTHTHTTPSGPSGPPIVPLTVAALSTKHKLDS